MGSWKFTSDEHFGHENIIKFCNRPFTDVNHMREVLIQNHNSVVKPDDHVIHLGDMFWHKLTEQQCVDIRMRLNGTHYYILGNHEKQMLRSKSLRSLFVWVEDLINLNIPGYPNIVLCHYAMKTWNGSHRGTYQLYGHSHNSPELELNNKSLSMDVGVDATNYYPISLEEVHNIMQKRKELLNAKS